MKNKISFVHAINQALFQFLKKDKKLIVVGLGVDDPKGVFGTTLGLQQKFGPERVFDMPTSENAMTGIGSLGSRQMVVVTIHHSRPSKCTMLGTVFCMRASGYLLNSSSMRSFTVV